MTSDQIIELPQIQTLHGWCTLEKGKAMAELILETHPQTAVELGVFGGRSLIAQGLAMKTIGFGVVWGIDPWTKEAAITGDVGDANKDWWQRLDIESIRNHAMSSIGQFDLWDYVRVIVARSEHCYKMFDWIDILHIDGNHSEESSCRDVTFWGHRVKAGGYIWFDDVDWSTTKKAVGLIEEFATKVKDVGSCSLYQVHE